MHLRSRERGTATPLVLAAIAVTCVLVTGVARVGGASVRTARAGAVADVVALAAVSGDEGRARQVAATSGAAVLEVVHSEGAVVEVLVELDGVRATAAAAPASGG